MKGTSMKNYLVLVSLSKANVVTGKKILSNLEAVAHGNVAPAWIDSAYIGIPIATESTAREIWLSAVAGINQDSDLRDLLIVELGRDWLTRKDARAEHWLTTHLGHPLRV
jgi:hypothetical protein